MFDLAIAVGIGIVISALVFAWNTAKQLRLEKIAENDQSITYALNGNLFFGSISAFKDLFHPEEDPNLVVVDFKDSKVYDHSGLEALHGLSEKYKALGKELHYRHLSKECSDLLTKAGSMIEINFSEDPDYHIADDRLA